MSMLTLSAVTGLGLAIAAWHFLRPAGRTDEPPSASWIAGLSVDRYAPMLRLLDETDFRHLWMQPGITAEMVERIRAQRYRLFVAYLRSLRNDFRQALSALKFIAAHSGIDRPELGAAIVRAEISFVGWYAAAYARAFLWSCGFGRVDASGLVGAFDTLRFAVRSMAVSPSAA
jgi:hypothetical protein